MWLDKYLTLYGGVEHCFLCAIYITKHLAYSSCIHNSGYQLTYSILQSLQTRFASIRITSTATTGKAWGFAIHASLSTVQWQ